MVSTMICAWVCFSLYTNGIYKFFIGLAIGLLWGLIVREGPYYLGVDLLYIPGFLTKFCDAFLNEKVKVQIVSNDEIWYDT